jgi:hypothetical protein
MASQGGSGAGFRPPPGAGPGPLTGLDGNDGPQGLDGADGDEGFPGAPGQPGARGVPGQMGAPGFDGEDGSDAFPAGPTNTAAPSGPAGGSLAGNYPNPTFARSKIFSGDATAGGANVVLADERGILFLPTLPNHDYTFFLWVLTFQIVNPALAPEAFLRMVTAHQAAAGNLVLDEFSGLAYVLFAAAPPGISAAGDVLRGSNASGLVLTGVASATVAQRYVVRVDWIESSSL